MDSVCTENNLFFNNAKGQNTPPRDTTPKAEIHFQPITSRLKREPKKASKLGTTMAMKIQINIDIYLTNC